MFWVGVDVGGTFTDVILYDVKGRRVSAAKRLSTPAEPLVAVLQGLEELKVDLSKTERFVHGTTRVTNALLEGTGKPVALITTAGFRDLIAMGRGHRRRLYSLKEQSPPCLVDRPLRFEVDERLRADGSILRPLNEAQLNQVLDQIEDLDVDGVAVCFLHSYSNPEHENRALELIRRRWPDRASSASSEVVPEIGEYERFATTVQNVKVKPFIDRYLSFFHSQLQEKGYGGGLSIMTSSGGVVSADDARRLPMQLALSGPAGGVAASAYVATAAGFPNVITCDMGGTSTDVCLICDGRPTMTNHSEIGGFPNKTFQIEIKTIGAGGGSVAWIDVGGELSIGPRSAGSYPGPACYGLGGQEPTTTDAHLLVGHLDAKAPLGGQVQPDVKAAYEAMARLAEGLGGIGVERLALGIIKVAVAKMASAIKEITYARGLDPRDFVLLPFGGAGPMHATMLADELGMSCVLVPPVPGNLSALGFIAARARMDLIRTVLMPLNDEALPHIAQVLAQLEAEGSARVDGGTDGDSVELQRSVGMRIHGQSFDLAVPIDVMPRSAEELRSLFCKAYEAHYAYLPESASLEIVNCRVIAFGPEMQVHAGGANANGTEAPQPTRLYHDEGWVDAHSYQRDTLRPGDSILGPAIVREYGATTVVGAGWKAEIDATSNMVLRRHG